MLVRSFLPRSRFIRPSLPLRKTLLSTQAGPVPRSRIPWFVRRGIRFAQVGVIAYTIYGVGYQLGLMQAIQFPADTERSMLLSVLPLSSATEEEIARFKAISKTNEYQRVSAIMHKVVASAQSILQQRLNELDEQADEELRERLSLGLRRLEGDWELVLFPRREVNAFVSSVCPRKIFLFTGLLDLVHPTDDELAMILGHELSHIALGHNEKKGDTAVFLLALQLMLLTLVDPTGLSAIFYDYLANLLRQLIDASHSRLVEVEADTLGLEITANACFDIRKGVVIMQKLAMVSQEIPVLPHHSDVYVHKHATTQSSHDSLNHEAGSAVDGVAKTLKDFEAAHRLPKHVPTSWLDTHPSSTERFDALKTMAEEMIVEFQTDFAIARHGMKSEDIIKNSDESLKSVKHINRPNHCYGVLADLERCGIHFTRWFSY